MFPVPFARACFEKTTWVETRHFRSSLHRRGLWHFFASWTSSDLCQSSDIVSTGGRNESYLIFKFLLIIQDFFGLDFLGCIC